MQMANSDSFITIHCQHRGAAGAIHRPWQLGLHGELIVELKL